VILPRESICDVESEAVCRKLSISDPWIQTILCYDILRKRSCPRLGIAGVNTNSISNSEVRTRCKSFETCSDLHQIFPPDFGFGLWFNFAGNESTSPLDGIQIIENFVFYFFVLTKSKTRTPSHKLVYPSSSLIEISTHSAYSFFPGSPKPWLISGLPHLYGARSLSRASASCPS
jgi:hypothetical protein